VVTFNKITNLNVNFIKGNGFQNSQLTALHIQTKIVNCRLVEGKQQRPQGQTLDSHVARLIAVGTFADSSLIFLLLKTGLKI
jgi:hypothetical protein